MLEHFVPAKELKITAPPRVGRGLIFPFGRANRNQIINVIKQKNLPGEVKGERSEVSML